MFNTLVRSLGALSVIVFPAITFAQTTVATAGPLLPLASSRASVQSETKPAAKAEPAALERMVTLDVRNVTLDAALDLIARQGNVRLVYGEAVVPLKHRVTVKERLTVGAALQRVLRGTGVVARPTASGNITLVKEPVADTTATQGRRITGRVIDSVSQRPLASVTVMIPGSRHSTLTRADGSFVLSGLEPGSYPVTVRVLGYASHQARVTVSSEQDATLSVALRPAVTELAGVVTTASGEQERLKIGHSISTINADSVVATMQVRTVSDLLEARVPGLTSLHTSGTVGSAIRLRVRGMRSAAMANDPIVILDGVRITNEMATEERDPNLPGRYNRPSRLDDLDPQMIESIDVLKGPSASSLYGSDAANGVIVIKTKRGFAGPPRWRLTGDWTTMTYPGDWPTRVQAYGHTLQAGSGSCGLTGIPTGSCPYLDSIARYQPMSDPLVSPFTRGHDAMVGANVSGGLAGLTYFFGGSYTNQLAAVKTPDIGIMLFERYNGPGSASDEMKRPNAQTNANFTANIGAQFGDVADLVVRSTLLHRYQRRGNEGIQSAWGLMRTPGDTVSIPQNLRGVTHTRNDRITRSTTGISGNWKPSSWLTLTGSYGYDHALTNDVDLLPRNRCQPLCYQNYGGEQDSIGMKWMGRRMTVTHSFDLRGVATTNLTELLTLRTAGAFQYVRGWFSELNAYGSGLAAGRNSLSSIGGRMAINELSDESAIAGWLLEETLGWRERLFLSVALRQDVAGALGADVKPLYPKWGLSYIISEEPFFAPLSNTVNLLRLRSAFGHAGIQPGSNFKLRSYSQLVRLVMPNGTLVNYAAAVSPGNQDLRPERSTEIEFGFDAELFDSRLRFDITWFRNNTRDAIMTRPLAPSLGITTSRRENVGTVRNTGTEATVGISPIRSSLVTWDVNVGYGSHRNMVVSLGPNVQPFSAYAVLQGMDDARVVAGYPLFGRWSRPIVGYYDANGDGILEMSEIRVGDSLVYMGPSEPRYTLSTSHNIGLWNNRISLSGTFNYINSLVQINRFRKDMVFQTGELNEVGAVSMERQGFLLAANGYSGHGVIEKVNILRFNTISISGVLPQQFARSFRASQATLSVIGTNLGMWTSYLGADPQVNTTGAAGVRVEDTGTLPLPRTWGVRLGLSF